MQRLSHHTVYLSTNTIPRSYPIALTFKILSNNNFITINTYMQSFDKNMYLHCLNRANLGKVWWQLVAWVVSDRLSFKTNTVNHLVLRSLYFDDICGKKRIVKSANATNLNWWSWGKSTSRGCFLSRSSVYHIPLFYNIKTNMHHTKRENVY